MILTSSYRRPEDVRIVPVVVAELKLRNVQRHVLGADLVERADHAALKDAPKAFNRVGVDRADYILVIGVADNFVRVFGVEFVEHAPVARDKRRNLVRNHRLSTLIEGLKINNVDHATDE